jgi:two-component system, NarL family, response regulator NreC
MTPATVVLADDHQVVREGLRLLLEAQPDLSVIGEASDGLQAADLVSGLKPDVLVVDLIMPGLGGLDVAREVRRRSPKTRIVILSMHSSDSFVLQALKNGASAYVLKDSSAAELVQAIHTVLAGRRYLSPPLSQKAIDDYVKRAEGTEAGLYETLTTREREVLHLAAEGLSNPGIGRRLGISPRTAETHRTHLMEKLGLRSTAALVLYAVQRGLVLGTPSDRPNAAPDEGSRED